MTDLAALVNHQIRLAARPNGLPTRDLWSFTTAPVPEPADGEVVVKTLSLSLDPAMRGWMNEGKSYIAPVGIGEVMRAGGIGRVVASNSTEFAPASPRVQSQGPPVPGRLANSPGVFVGALNRYGGPRPD